MQDGERYDDRKDEGTMRAIATQADMNATECEACWNGLVYTCRASKGSFSFVKARPLSFIALIFSTFLLTFSLHGNSNRLVGFLSSPHLHTFTTLYLISGDNNMQDSSLSTTERALSTNFSPERSRETVHLGGRGKVN